MFHTRTTVDQDVVEEDHHELGFGTLFMRASNVNGALVEPKRHDQELEMDVMHAEGYPGDVVEMHPHLVVHVAQVEIGEEARPLELIQ